MTYDKEADNEARTVLDKDANTIPREVQGRSRYSQSLIRGLNHQYPGLGLIAIFFFLGPGDR